MTPLIPEHFRRDMIIVHGEKKALDWLERLPAILESCAQRWDLTLLPPEANLSFHYVAPAVRADGTRVIVKPTRHLANLPQRRRPYAYSAGQAWRVCWKLITKMKCCCWSG
ncbi:MAG TPA: hypothetical protein VF458_02270 [Ktedonobacteraceae bacterium]